MTLPWEGTDLKAGLCLCVYIQLREQTKVQINDNPTGPEVIALHHEALTLYFKVCVCVCVHICPRIGHPTTDDLLLSAKAMPSLRRQSWTLWR